MRPVQVFDNAMEALKRLPARQQNKPRLAAIISAFCGKQFDKLEQVFFDLLDLRSIDSAVGTQLDLLGDMVGIKRMGLGDDAYRLRVRVRILVNISEGDSEGLIKIFQALTQTPRVIMGDWGFGGFGMFMQGDPVESDIEFIRETMEEAAMGGVRFEAFGSYDDLEPFAFDGIVQPGRGFGDLNDLSVGGKLGKLHYFGPSFAFDGIDTSGAGFGTTADPLVGGRMVSL